MLAVGYLCRSKFTNSVCLVNSSRQQSCVTHWPCVQMPMYVALKFGSEDVWSPTAWNQCVSETFFERKHGANVSLSQAKVPREVTYVYHEVSYELVQIDFRCFFFPVISYFKSYCLSLCMCVGLEAPLKWCFLKLWIIMLVSVNIISSSPAY